MAELTPVRLIIEDAAVARLAAARAARVPGVAALRPDPARTAGALPGADRPSRAADGVGVVVHGDATEITVAIVTRLGDNCRDVAVAVQRAVRAELSEQAGLAVRVTVTIADVLLD